MSIEVELPDGGIAEFPDGMAPDAIKFVLQKKFGGGLPSIDFNRPIEAVRADIAKLPETQREPALKQWADAFVKREREQGGIGQSIDNAVRTVARGTFAGEFLDEVTAGSQQALHSLTGGYVGAPYDETLAYQRAKDRAVDEANPVMSTLGKLAGGVGGAVGALRAGSGSLSALAGGPLGTMRAAATVPGRMAQGAAAGAVYGGTSGFGSGEGIDARLQGAAENAAAGGVLGAVAPPLIEGAGAGIRAVGNVVSPTVARYGQELRNRGWLPAEQKAHSLSAAAADSAPVASGADAAAEEMIANQLLRSNVSARDLRARWAAADEASRFHTSGRAQNVLAAADLDPSLARLAGSAGRQNPEAFNIMKQFQDARQTGVTPTGRTQMDMADVGLPTRAPFAPPVRGGKYAEETLGRRFDTVDDDTVPMGQMDRVRDALKRAFLISDEGYHKHAKTAFRQEEALIKGAKDEAKELYGDVYKKAAGIDLNPTLGPVLQNWSARLIDEPLPVARQLKRAIGAFERAMSPAGTKSHLERVQKVKEVLDDVIDTAFQSSNGRQRYLGGQLTEFKNEVLAALDKVPKIGDKYAAARAAFSDKMAAREAIELGRSAIKENSEVAVDQIMAIPEGPMRKLVRLGMLDQIERDAARKGRNQDVTAVFNTPRMQSILQEIIPRSDKASGVFANRPERFGRYIGDQRSMIDTRNITLGGSSTVRNLEDDQAFNGISGAIDKFRSSGSLINVGIEAVSAAMSKMFGMRADTAAALAFKLFNADPQQRQKLLVALERRMGTDRAAAIAQLLSNYERQMIQATSTLGGGSGQP